MKKKNQERQKPKRRTAKKKASPAGNWSEHNKFEHQTLFGLVNGPHGQQKKKEKTGNVLAIEQGDQPKSEESRWSQQTE